MWIALYCKLICFFEFKVSVSSDSFQRYAQRDVIYTSKNCRKMYWTLHSSMRVKTVQVFYGERFKEVILLLSILNAHMMRSWWIFNRQTYMWWCYENIVKPECIQARSPSSDSKQGMRNVCVICNLKRRLISFWNSSPKSENDHDFFWFVRTL